MKTEDTGDIKMLGLKLPTDPRWVNIVEKNVEEILTDHAYCEQKAASTAISLIVSFPEYTELVQEMIALVKEGLGITVLPELACRDLSADLGFFIPKPPIYTRKILALWAPDKVTYVGQIAFLHLLQNY